MQPPPDPSEGGGVGMRGAKSSPFGGTERGLKARMEKIPLEIIATNDEFYNQFIIRREQIPHFATLHSE